MKKAPRLNLNASAAHTWTECTAQPHYVLENAHRIPPQDTEFSVEGTQAHKVVECLFNGDKLPPYATPEMKGHGRAFVDYCHALRDKPSTPWQSEMKVDLFYMPGRSGYVDWCSIAEAIHICDYKYGQGVSVSAFENLQMAIYARSAVKQSGLSPRLDTPVHLHIFQPRVRQGDRQSCWSITWGELVQFTDDRVLGPAQDIQARALTLEFRPGEKTCQFCPANSFCTARASWLLDDTPLEPMLKGEAPILKSPESTPEEQLARVIARKDEIIKWLGQVDNYALQMATAGKALPGTKIVLSKGGHRKWGDDATVKQIMASVLPRESFISEKIITPKQAEEFEFDFTPEQWKQIQALVIKPEGKPVLTGEDDPRPAYSPTSAADAFDDETVEEWI